MTSDELVKSVSRKLKYYFQVKRLEDSFDLSGSHVPVLDHPPRIGGPIVHYPSVYDRSLKHYFSHPEARVQLTQFKSPLDHGDSLEKMGKVMTKEERIRNVVEKYLRRYNFAPAPQPVPFQAFMQTKKGLRLRPELRGIRSPYRCPSRRAKGFRGAYPTLRMTPNSDVSRNEGDRLVNTATRLLLATQSVNLSADNYDTTASGSKLQYLPNSEKALAAERRRQIRSGGRVSGSSSAKRSVSSDRTSQDCGHLPAWLRKEISRLADEEDRTGSHDQSPYVRAYSAPTPPKGDRRSSSGSGPRRRSLRRRTVGDGSENIATQTERASEADDQSSRQVENKDLIEYNVQVTTGNQIGASTNADVYLTLFGSLGRSPEVQLVNSKTHRLMFRKGQTDEFSIQLPYVGNLKRIQIGHNSHESGSDWFLDSVIITDPRANQPLRCKCSRWLSTREADGLTKRILQPSVDPPPPPAADPKPEESAGRDSRSSFASSSNATATATASQTGEEEDRSSRSARSRTDSGSSTEVTASSRNETARSESSESYTTESESESETEREDKKVRASSSDEEEEESEEEERQEESKAESEARASQLDPIEEEAEGRAGESAQAASGRSSAQSTPRGKEEEEDEEIGRVEIDGEEAEFDFDDKRGAPTKSIHQSIEDGDLKQVIELISQNEKNVNYPDERGFLPLHIACERGHLDIVKWLCANGASVGTDTPTGYGPLHLATLEGHLKCMMALNALGADLNSTTVDGQTALHIAAKNAHLDVVQWLVSGGANVELEDMRGMKPIAWATQYGHSEVVDYLRGFTHDRSNIDGDMNDTNDNEPPPSTTPPPVRVVPKRLSRRRTEESLLEEKRKNYQRQVDAMSSSSSSFLDAIRNETM